MRTPLVFDIKRASAVDGEGLRTAIFFKGCNLDCYWCHNPESKNAGVQYAYYREKCIGCGACGGKSDAVTCCPAEARKLYGREYTVNELMDIILSDKPYYDATDGGVTFSGGECMLYPEYISNLAKACSEHEVSVAIDTAGNVPFENFDKVIAFTDVFLYDIKAVSPKLHIEGTKADNGRILQNLDKLLALGKRVVIRVPVIPNFNDGDELIKIKEYCLERNLDPELLPYHNIGESKKQALI